MYIDVNPYCFAVYSVSSFLGRIASTRNMNYTPELIAKKLSADSTRRIENNDLNTIDFIDERDDSSHSRVILRIHPKEKGKLVCQIGSADPFYAVKAAQKIEKDVVAIDLNCGCPKPFSVHDGSGSALLETPDLLESILKQLVAAVSIPITCKIRLLPSKEGVSSLERTISLLKRLEKTGIVAIGVHCRVPTEKPRDPGHWYVFQEIAQRINLPIIANGDIWNLDDAYRLKKLYPSISSFMFARGAERNVSLFRKEGVLSIEKVMVEYLKLAIQFKQHYSNTKYVLVQMERETQGKNAMYHKIRSLKSLEELSILFGIHDFYCKFNF